MISDADYTKALQFVLRWEGGYSNHPSDKGGETNFGITHATYDIYRKSKGLAKRSVRLISMDEVKDIYKNSYWIPSGCELLRPKLAAVHFDWAINHGVKGAIKTLQRLVRVQEDGIIGDMTKTAITKTLANFADKTLATDYCLIRQQKYNAFIAHDSSQGVFKDGWMNRLNDLRKTIA